MATFQTSIKVRFEHTDPAGIVFFPRYFTMLNAVVEDWFEGPLEYSFRRLVMDHGMGVPTVHVEADFVAPSKIGDILDFNLGVTRIGRSSCGLKVAAAANGDKRLTMASTIVHISRSEGKAVPWPEALRTRMAAYQIPEGDRLAAAPAGIAT